MNKFITIKTKESDFTHEIGCGYQIKAGNFIRRDAVRFHSKKLIPIIQEKMLNKALRFMGAA